MGLTVAAPGCVPAQVAPAEHRVPFQLVGGRPHVQVYVNGQGPFAFGVDTGAQGAGRADSLLVAAVGLPVDGAVAVTDGIATRQQATVRVDSIRLGDLTIRGLSMPTRSYGLRTSGGAPLLGILGPASFADYTFTLDYPRSEIRITSRRLDPFDPHTVAYERPFRVPIQIGATATTAHIDSGLGEGLHIPIADTAAVKPEGLTVVGEGTTTQSRVSISAGMVRLPITIAGHRLDPLEVVFTNALREVVVGGPVLRRFELTIDQRSRLVRLAPPSGP